MQIGKKGFPYPVLNNAKNFNCYINKKKGEYDYEKSNGFMSGHA